MQMKKSVGAETAEVLSLYGCILDKRAEWNLLEIEGIENKEIKHEIMNRSRGNNTVVMELNQHAVRDL